MNYDYIIVGAGLTGCVLAENLSKNNSVLIVERRNHIGGNCYDYYNDDHILVHKYGPHFFHTNDSEVWNYLSRFTPWHYYQHRVLSYVDGGLHPFPLPPSKMKEGNNLEKFYLSYTRKQWGKYAEALDDSVLKRVVMREESFDTRYFTDKYQAMPKYGYTKMMSNMIKDIPIILNTDFLAVADTFSYKRLFYTGRIDEYFSNKLPSLPYLSLKFEHETVNQELYQPVAQINFPLDYDFTRIIEIKHATGQKSEKTTIVREYPFGNGDPFYPIPSKETEELYNKYKEMAEIEKYATFIGRLAEYRYYNMDHIVKNALSISKRYNFFVV